jgi:hypothetical protein
VTGRAVAVTVKGGSTTARSSIDLPSTDPKKIKSPGADAPASRPDDTNQNQNPAPEPGSSERLAVLAEQAVRKAAWAHTLTLPMIRRFFRELVRHAGVSCEDALEIAICNGALAAYVDARDAAKAGRRHM